MTTATIAMNPKIRFDCFFVCLTLSYVQCVCVHCNVDCSKYFFIKFLNVVYQSATDCFSLFRPICHFTRAISSWHSLSVGWFVCVFVAPSPYSFTSCCLWILFRALFAHPSIDSQLKPYFTTMPCIYSYIPSHSCILLSL